MAADRSGALRWSRDAEGQLSVELCGPFTLERGLVDPGPLLSEIRGGARRIAFDAARLADWDSALVTVLWKLERGARELGVEFDSRGLPEGARRLLRLAAAGGEPTGAGENERAGSDADARRTPATRVLERVGSAAVRSQEGGVAMLGFLGEVALALARLAVGRARVRGQDLAAVIARCGPDALPIVTLISVLVGLILGFVGAVQLEEFGAEIFVADLVAIGMAREMGALMTGILLAGRTGAAFAAELGTMTSNEEIDALRTMGIPPIEFLVLPRVLGLVAMLPLLCIYADLLGIAGGGIVCWGLLGISWQQYADQAFAAVDLADFGIGLAKSGAFGILVGYAGCLRGIQAGRSAESVGRAATSAVVTALVLIVVADGVFAVVTHVLGL